MNIGKAAAASGVSAKMIRYYESIGLLPPPQRSTSGYRLYSEADVHTLRFIRRARSLGFAVPEIRRLAALWQDRERASAEVKCIALAHVAELESRIAALESMARTLRHLANHCHGNQRPQCPILDDLAGGAGPGAGSGRKMRRQPEHARQDEVHGHGEVERPGHQQDHDAGHQGDQRLEYDDVDVHGRALPGRSTAGRRRRPADS